MTTIKHPLTGQQVDDLPQETVEALQHVINTYIAPRRIDWSDPGYAEQAKVDLAFILNASPPSVSPEGVYDGWAVCLVKRVKDLEPFAATWVKARQNPDKPSAWWFYRPRHIYKGGGGGVHYKLLPETFISKGDWETRYHA